MQAHLLESSLAQIESRREEFSARFYEHLFTLRPDVQPLFSKTNMAEQQRMLMSALYLIVRNCQKPTLFGPMLQGLGSRHIGYGTEGDCFPDMGRALVATFAEYLGDQWSADLETAWLTAFGEISRHMLAGVKQG
ncbi:hypothetical protein BST81_08035 [Leptolyngbya sp. 'hensonii']|nr:hypothetical protein BST81_08035 [Leptolyngbya sp. 'hensonii']